MEPLHLFEEDPHRSGGQSRRGWRWTAIADRHRRIADVERAGAEAAEALDSFLLTSRCDLLLEADMAGGIPDPATADGHGDACYSLQGRNCVKFSDYPTRQSRMDGKIWRVRFSTTRDRRRRGNSKATRKKEIPTFFPPDFIGRVGESQTGMSGVEALSAGWFGHF